MITKLEEIRKKLRDRYIIFIIIVLITLFIGIFCLIPEILLVITLEILIAFVFTNKLSTQYKMTFKKIFVEEDLKRIFDNLCYNPEKGLPSKVIDSTDMIDMGDRYSSNDYISGQYKGINFEQADVHIEERHVTYDSDGHTQVSYVTIFKGRWLVFEFNKSFKAKLQVRQKGFDNAKVKTFFVKKDEKFKRINLESEGFNKNFKVYAQSEHEAFYLLTPALMERIERLCKNNGGKFLFCFIDQKLHIGLQNGKDSFKPTSVFRKLDVEKIKQDVSGDILLITQFVDELKLDNKLFKVEV